MRLSPNRVAELLSPQARTQPSNHDSSPPPLPSPQRPRNLTRTAPSSLSRPRNARRRSRSSPRKSPSTFSRSGPWASRRAACSPGPSRATSGRSSRPSRPASSPGSPGRSRRTCARVHASCVATCSHHTRQSNVILLEPSFSPLFLSCGVAPRSAHISTPAPLVADRPRPRPQGARGDLHGWGQAPRRRDVLEVRAEGARLPRQQRPLVRAYAYAYANHPPLCCRHGEAPAGQLIASAPDSFL